MPYFGFLTQSSAKSKLPVTSKSSAVRKKTMSAASTAQMSVMAAKVANGPKEVGPYDSEVNEWSELLTNEQEIAIHPVDPPPSGSYLPVSPFVHQHPAPDPWRLPPKQQPGMGRSGPNPPPRDWIELRNSLDSPSKQQQQHVGNGASSVSGRLGENRPPPPPPPTSAPLPLPPQPPPKKQQSNSCTVKTAPPPPLPHNSRGELLRNKVQSDIGASSRGLSAPSTPTATDPAESRTSSPSIVDRQAQNSNTTGRRTQAPSTNRVTSNDKNEGGTVKRPALPSPTERHSDEGSTPISSEVKGPAPQPPTQLRDSQAPNNNTTITKQPQRSMSVSRGLQVEEDDLIQFSDGQPGSKKSGLGKNGLKSEQLDEPHEGGEEDDDADDDTESARTADEQMDYLEGLEPCPCYAKCCLDSIITLFCVTLLG